MLILFSFVEGAQVYAPSQPDNIGQCFANAWFSVCFTNRTPFFPCRCRDVRYPLTYAGQEHRNGVREIRLAQKRDRTRSRCSEKTAQGGRDADAVRQAELLERFGVGGKICDALSESVDADADCLEGSLTVVPLIISP